MIRYVPSSAADALSHMLWTLADPEPTRGTTAMFPTVRALDDSLWLQVETTFSVPVHPDAVLDGIADILQPWIDQGHLPADTNTVLAALVEELRGQRLVVYDAFPDLFKQMSKSYDDMIAEGKLAAPQTP